MLLKSDIDFAASTIKTSKICRFRIDLGAKFRSQFYLVLGKTATAIRSLYLSRDSISLRKTLFFISVFYCFFGAVFFQNYSAKQDIIFCYILPNFGSLSTSTNWITATALRLDLVSKIKELKKWGTSESLRKLAKRLKKRILSRWVNRPLIVKSVEKTKTPPWYRETTSGET